jgi:WD40-like Beta Propeller Repeat
LPAAGAAHIVRGVFASSILATLLLTMASGAPAAVALPAPVVFAPGVISGPGNGGTPTFSPDGRTLYIARYGASWSVILESHRTDSGWSKPVVAPFSGPSSDVQPAFSPDGRTIVFASRRVLPGTPPRRVSNLWQVMRTPSGWSDPQRLPDAVNISKNVHNPSIAANGDLYFTSPAVLNGADTTWALYRSSYRNGSYAPALPLSFRDATPLDANEPFIAPDQSYLIFGSRGITAPLGPKHLYIACRAGASWGPVVPIRYDGDDWDTGHDDAEPEVGPDGTTLYFNSTRSIPIDPNRTRTQMLVDVARLDAWDNGNSHVWTLPLRPLLDALHDCH